MPLFDPGDPLIRNRHCDRCATELAPRALACPSCSALVHRARLQELADLAATAATAGDRAAARQHWQDALTLVPPASEQHRLIAGRIAGLREDVPAVPAGPSQSQRSGSWWKQALGGAVTIGLLLVGKLKFLLLGLTKASTFISMFGFMAVYWGLYGWPLALGLVISIYIHEMGHVAMLRRLGIAAGAPLFIPGVGAVVMLKERVTDPIADARIGLAGPVWGAGAALIALVLGFATGHRVMFGVAYFGAVINVFNLLPVWQLDGGRAFVALSRRQRAIVAGVVWAAGLVTGNPICFLVAIAATFRAASAGGAPTEGDRNILLTYAGLVAGLAAIMIAAGKI